jgi:uncharacterized protein (TIGR02453 family)
MNDVLFSKQTYQFFNEIANNNHKEWFHANKKDYEQYVKEPLKKLTQELNFEFGEAHIFRINRDVRFSNDKSPYKTSASFFINSGVGGLYFQIGGDGIYVGGGLYEPQSDQLLRWRQIFDTKEKANIKKVIEKLEDEGFALMTEHVLKSAPRGWKPDHEEIEYLRLQNLVIGKSLGNLLNKSNQETLQIVKEVFHDIEKFNAILEKYIGASKIPNKFH